MAEWTPAEDWRLTNLKRELYCQLLKMPASAQTDNDIDLMLFLAKDATIQERLKAELEKPGR